MKFAVRGLAQVSFTVGTLPSQSGNTFVFIINKDFGPFTVLKTCDVRAGTRPRKA